MNSWETCFYSNITGFLLKTYIRTYNWFVTRNLSPLVQRQSTFGLWKSLITTNLSLFYLYPISSVFFKKIQFFKLLICRESNPGKVMQNTRKLVTFLYWDLKTKIKKMSHNFWAWSSTSSSITPEDVSEPFMSILYQNSDLIQAKVNYSISRHQFCMNWALLYLRPIILHLRKKLQT